MGYTAGNKIINQHVLKFTCKWTYIPYITLVVYKLSSLFDNACSTDSTTYVASVTYYIYGVLDTNFLNFVDYNKFMNLHNFFKGKKTCSSEIWSLYTGAEFRS